MLGASLYVCLCLSVATRCAHRSPLTDHAPSSIFRLRRTASHRSCAPHQFLCPDRVTCVEDAHAYAACATGFAPDHSLLAAARLAAQNGTCKLTGKWKCGDGTSPCALNMTSPTAFTVAPTGSGPFTWTKGTATVSASGAVSILYTGMTGAGPAGRTGTIDSACTSISWNDTSTW